MTISVNPLQTGDGASTGHGQVIRSRRSPARPQSLRPEGQGRRQAGALRQRSVDGQRSVEGGEEA